MTLTLICAEFRASRSRRKGRDVDNFGSHGTQLGTGAVDLKLDRIVGQPFGSR